MIVLALVEMPQKGRVGEGSWGMRLGRSAPQFSGSRCHCPLPHILAKIDVYFFEKVILAKKESVQIFTKGSILEPKSSFHNAMLYSTQLIVHEYSEVRSLK